MSLAGQAVWVKFPSEPIKRALGDHVILSYQFSHAKTAECFPEARVSEGLQLAVIAVNKKNTFTTARIEHLIEFPEAAILFCSECKQQTLPSSETVHEMGTPGRQYVKFIELAFAADALKQMTGRVQATKLDIVETYAEFADQPPFEQSFSCDFKQPIIVAG